MITSGSNITQITEALLKAQKEMGSATKEAKNPYFRSKYADLPTVMEVCKEPLNKNGIIILQPVVEDVLETWLIHTSGEFMYSQTKIICKEPDNPQAYGSAISYARRYGLQSLLFIPAEDDDGNKANETQGDQAILSALKKLTSMIQGAKTTDELDGMAINIEKAKEYVTEKEYKTLTDLFHNKYMELGK